MVFSGIIEEVGEIVMLEKKNDVTHLWDGSVGDSIKMTIKAKLMLDGIYNGASICVNGTCLTVTKFDDRSFQVGLAPETLRRTYLGNCRAGDVVNLERALQANGRNSGHYVQGHVDGIGDIRDMFQEGDSLWIRINTPSNILRNIVPKGFIAVDGTSLTVCEVNKIEGWFSFMLVAYTQKHIIIPSKKIGDKVNLETDVIGKYVEKSLATLVDRLDNLETNFTTFMKSNQQPTTNNQQPTTNNQQPTTNNQQQPTRRQINIVRIN